MQFDWFILNGIQESLRTDSLDFIMAFISRLSDMGAIWIITTLILLIIPKTRLLGLALLIALVLESFCVNLILKPLIARERPFAINEAIHLYIAAPKDASFPSGHSGASFACAFSFIFMRTKAFVWAPALILASLIAFSRIYLYVHYPSDVLAGMLIGCLTAFVAATFVRKKLQTIPIKSD